MRNKFKKYFAKDPEVDTGLESFFEHISGGSGAPKDEIIEEDPEEEEESEEEDLDEDLDPRSQEDEESDEDEGGDEEDEEESEESNTDPNADIIAQLQEQNRQLTEALKNVSEHKDKVEEKPKEPSLFESEGFSALGEALELDKAGATLLQTFLEKYGNHIASKAANDALDRTPELVTTQITKSNQAEEVKKNFYDNHPALESIKPYVAQVANTVAQENGSLTVAQVLEETAKRAYTNLNIDPKKVNKAQKSGKRKPAFAKAPKSGRKAKPKKTALQTDIDRMMATIS